MIERQKLLALQAMLCLIFLLSNAFAQQAVWTVSDYQSFVTFDTSRYRNISFDSTAGDGAVFLAPSTENFAMGGEATDDIGNTSNNNPNNVIDGNPSTFWHTLDERSTGIGITLDLKAIRTIDEVRIVGTPLDTINFRVKGYLIELSLDGESWQVAAKNEDNPVRKDAIEIFNPIVAQYVRVTVIKTDLKNWTFIGEIEVYGSGYASNGYYISEIKNFGKNVNFGIATWDVDLPDGTDMSMQFRSQAQHFTQYKTAFPAGSDTLRLYGPVIPGTEYLRNLSGDVVYYSSFDYVLDYKAGVLLRLPSGNIAPGDSFYIDWRRWGDWTEPTATRGSQFKVFEPRPYFQFKANLTTRSLNTPLLKQVDIHYSESPVVSSATAEVSPDTVAILKESALTYKLTLNFADSDLGIDTLVIGTPTAARVADVSFQGESMSFEDASTAKALIIAFDPPLKGNGWANLEVKFSTTLIQTDNEFPSYLISSATRQNYQFIEDFGWDVSALGIPEAPLLRVEVKPNPFSPNNDGVCDYTTITFYTAKISHPQSLVVKIFNLNGVLIRVLHDEYSPADFYQLQWDGRDDGQELVLPGVYIFQVRIKADAGDFHQTRLITVMY